jgi:inositol-phosphate phosphatase/L-galactose 1-phosphate phosphatase/histidinol-phosphatase
MTSNLEEFISFSNHLADESAKIIKQYFRKKISVSDKEDQSPVTIADKNTELKIRELIEIKYPNHGILGEEFEIKNANSEFTWVIDPIDGTRSFIAGSKDFGTLIALLHNKKPIIGIINCPAHEERWVGVEGQKTKMNNQEVKTSNIEILEKSYLSSTGLYMFKNDNFKKGFDKIIKKTRYHRFGGDCYNYGMVASGFIDIVIEDTLKVHDYMALVPVIEGAGGKLTDKFGESINLKSNGSIVVSANEKLHTQLIDIINNPILI